MMSLVKLSSLTMLLFTYKQAKSSKQSKREMCTLEFLFVEVDISMNSNRSRLMKNVLMNSA